MVAGVVLVQEAGGSTLFGNGKARRWSNWEVFLQRALERPFGEDTAVLRKLYIDILAGNSHLVQQRASHIQRRRLTLVGKVRRQVQKTWKRLKAALQTTAPAKDSSPSTPST
jgi:hypothetical protein